MQAILFILQHNLSRPIHLKTESGKFQQPFAVGFKAGENLTVNDNKSGV
jgi:hypothetical protein